jgi:hypothetical protein
MLFPLDKVFKNTLAGAQNSNQTTCRVSEIAAFFCQDISSINLGQVAGYVEFLLDSLIVSRNCRAVR